jgi:hypothetical protein
MTDPGKIEAKIRHQFLVDFLMQFFYEENALTWIKFIKQKNI